MGNVRNEYKIVVGELEEKRAIRLYTQTNAQVTNTSVWSFTGPYVSARLCHPQGFHTSNLKLAKI